MSVLTKFGARSPTVSPSPPIRDYQRIMRIESARMRIVPLEGAIRADAIRSDPHPIR